MPGAEPCALLQLSEPRAPNVARGCSELCAPQTWRGMLRAMCAPNVAGDAQSSVHPKCHRGFSELCAPKTLQRMLSALCAPNVAGDAQSSWSQPQGSIPAHPHSHEAPVLLERLPDTLIGTPAMIKKKFQIKPAMLCSSGRKHLFINTAGWRGLHYYDFSNFEGSGSVCSYVLIHPANLCGSQCLRAFF